MKRFLSLAVCSVLLFGAMTSCTPKAEEPKASQEVTAEKPVGEKPAEKVDSTIRISWWGGQARHEKTIAVTELYTAANPEIKFEYEYSSWSDYWDKLATQAASNTLPDILQHDYAFLRQWIDKNQLADLTEFTKDGTLDLSNCAENFVSPGILDGKFYGLSLGSNALSFVYSPERYVAAGLKEPDENYTFEQLYKDESVILEKTGAFAPVNLAKDPKFMLEYFLREQGKTLYNEAGDGLGFDDPTILVDLFKHVADDYAAGLSPNKDELFAVIDAQAEDQLLVNDVIFGEVLWSNFFIPYQNSTEKDLKITVMPHSENKKQFGSYIKASQFFTVSESSQNKRESAKFMSYFINDIEANKVLLAERGVPVSSVVRTGLEEMVDETTMKVFDFIELAEKNSSPIDPPEPAGASEIASTIRAYHDKIIYGETTPEQAANDFMKQANGILAKNKK